MRADRGRLTAHLRSASKPTEAQLQRFNEFLSRTYQRKVPLHWEGDESLQDGFRLQVNPHLMIQHINQPHFFFVFQFFKFHSSNFSVN